MKLKRPGTYLNQVDVNIGEKVMVTIWDCGCFTGYVNGVTDDYISLTDLEQIDKLFPHSTIFIKKPSIFYNEEIYCIVSVEAQKEGVA
ncbi:MAG: hypothetical protein Q8934_22020 [Bacillota bacterium]|nr:hypothetical protein [Bacillota bacterium]